MEIHYEDDVDQLCETLIKCMISASELAVTKSQYCSYKRKPYWTSEIHEMHTHQKMLRQSWIYVGRPRGPQSSIYVEYKQANRRYAKALRIQV